MSVTKTQIMNFLKTHYSPSDFYMYNWNQVNKYPVNTLYRVATEPVNTHAPGRRRAYRLRYGRNAPMNLNSNENLSRKYPKRVFPKTVVVNNKNYRTRRQIKGTCWFSAILNGWLLSTEGRFIMRKKLRAFKMSHNMRPYTNVHACPPRGKLPTAYFWSYVEHMLSPKRNNTNFRMNVLRQKEFPESKLIRSSSVRTKNMSGTVVSGGDRDFDIFHQIVFRDDPDLIDTDLKILNSNMRNIPERYYRGHGINFRYDLSHAVIMKNGHAIAGYRNGNRYMIIDSNFNVPKVMDWQRNPDLVRAYLDEMYPDPPFKKTPGQIYLVYIKHIKPANIAPPETRLNTNKYNPKVNKSRYPKKLYLKFFRQLYNKNNFSHGNANGVKRFLSPFTFPPPTNANLNKLRLYVIGSVFNKNLKNPVAIRRSEYRRRTGKVADPGTIKNFMNMFREQ